jgi:hypothetical protein
VTRRIPQLAAARIRGISQPSLRCCSILRVRVEGSRWSVSGVAFALNGVQPACSAAVIAAMNGVTSLSSLGKVPCQASHLNNLRWFLETKS